VRRLVAVATLAAVSMIAACAGDGGTQHDRAATERCLRENGYSPEVWPPNTLPFHGGPAADGVIRFDSGEMEIGIAFDADAAAAQERVEALKTTASEWSPNPWFNVFERDENVVYWATSDQPDDRPDEALENVENCLTQ
jgi:hypothetical protein